MDEKKIKYDHLEIPSFSFKNPSAKTVAVRCLVNTTGAYNNNMKDFYVQFDYSLQNANTNGSIVSFTSRVFYQVIGGEFEQSMIDEELLRASLQKVKERVKLLSKDLGISELPFPVKVEALSFTSSSSSK